MGEWCREGWLGWEVGLVGVVGVLLFSFCVVKCCCFLEFWEKWVCARFVWVCVRGVFVGFF